MRECVVRQMACEQGFFLLFGRETHRKTGCTQHAYPTHGNGKRGRVINESADARSAGARLWRGAFLPMRPRLRVRAAAFMAQLQAM